MRTGSNKCSYVHRFSKENILKIWCYWGCRQKKRRTNISYCFILYIFTGTIWTVAIAAIRYSTFEASRPGVTCLLHPLLLIANRKNFVVPFSVRHLDSHLFTLFLADKRTGDRRANRDFTLVNISLIIPDNLVGHFLVPLGIQ